MLLSVLILLVSGSDSGSQRDPPQHEPTVVAVKAVSLGSFGIVQTCGHALSDGLALPAAQHDVKLLLGWHVQSLA